MKSKTSCFIKIFEKMIKYLLHLYPYQTTYGQNSNYSLPGEKDFIH